MQAIKNLATPLDTLPLLKLLLLQLLLLHPPLPSRTKKNTRNAGPHTSHSPHLRTRNPIPIQQGREIWIGARGKVMSDVVVNIVHRDRRRRRTRRCDFIRGACISQTLTAVGIDTDGAGAAGVGCAACALCCELPVRGVGFVASREGSVGCAGVLLGCGVAGGPSG